MKLEYTQSLGVTDLTQTTDSAGADDVLRLFDWMSWEQLSRIQLTNAQGIRLEFSGSLADGFSATYTEAGKSFISCEAPTQDDAKQLLSRFANSDESWRDTITFEYWQNEDGSVDPLPKPRNKIVEGLMVSAFSAFNGIAAAILFLHKLLPPVVILILIVVVMTAQSVVGRVSMVRLLGMSMFMFVIAFFLTFLSGLGNMP